MAFVFISCINLRNAVVSSSPTLIFSSAAIFRLSSEAEAWVMMIYVHHDSFSESVSILFLSIHKFFHLSQADFALAKHFKTLCCCHFSVRSMRPSYNPFTTGCTMGPPSASVGGDIPVQVIASIMTSQWGLIGPTLESSVVGCMVAYSSWSVLQYFTIMFWQQ